MAAAEAVGGATADLDSLLSQLGELLSDLIGSGDTATPALECAGRFWHLWHSLKSRSESPLSVALLALAKSGEAVCSSASNTSLYRTHGYVRCRQYTRI